MRYLAAIVLLVLLSTCTRSKVLVVATGLVEGGGGAGTNSLPTLDILVTMENDATGFNPGDLMTVNFDSEDRTGEIVMGGLYALLRLDPPPALPGRVELYRHFEPLLDSFTWDSVPYTGPTISAVTPNEAQVGTQVSISGSGFSAGVLRVFFGGIEGTVDSSTDVSISATVPADAVPGLVMVLVDDFSAYGVVGFQPLDAMGQPVEPPVSFHLFSCFPSSAPVQTAVQIWGVNFTVSSVPYFNDASSSRVFGIEIIDVPPIGEILTGFAVAVPKVPTGAGTLRLEQSGAVTNELPINVEDSP
ncbi:MAG: IPT/TIG domain-containing protein [Planctomycetota bacterium]|jgi:hypothetical protein